MLAPYRLRTRINDFGFNNKKDNIIGLQLADLIAYPVTVHLLHPERYKPLYEAVKHNIFQDNGMLLGQKVIPHYGSATMRNIDSCCHFFISTLRF